MDKTQIMFTILTIICTIITLIITIKTYGNNNKKDDKVDLTERVKKDTQIITKLDMILNDNSELKSDIKAINNNMDLYREKLARVDESCKQAHKRIDELSRKNI